MDAPPADPKKKQWIGYTIFAILGAALLILLNTPHPRFRRQMSGTPNPYGYGSASTGEIPADEAHTKASASLREGLDLVDQLKAPPAPPTPAATVPPVEAKR